MTLDIQKKHTEIRQAITKGTPGYAQSDISGQMVSYDVHGGPPGRFWYGFPNGAMHSHDLLQEMIVDVASNEGVASDGTFKRKLVEWMIDDRRAFKKSIWPKKHAEAERLAALLQARPGLFV